MTAPFFRPTPNAYQAALLRSRRRLGSLTATTAQDLVRALVVYADQIGRELRRASTVARLRNLTATRNILLRAARDLEVAMLRAVAQGRSVSFSTVLGLMQTAGRQAFRELGVSDALLGQVRIPPLSMLGAYESLGAPQTWRTLLRGHVRRAAAEANAIIRQGILVGMGPDELARRLRPYVIGSQPFRQAFGSTIDLRRIPVSVRGAAGQMVYNAERIAFTELHNARAEAEVQHYIQDPLVAAVRWTLATNRGSVRPPDECDWLARGNYYGLGRGIYPVRRVPRPPHPWDRCEREPVVTTRPGFKPDPQRTRSPHSVTVQGMQHLTPRAAARARTNALEALRFGDAAADAA